MYLIAGDEPLLVAEACDSVRAGARQVGYGDREVHFVERGFDWAALLAGARNMSLFAERRLIEVRLAQPPDAAATKALGAAWAVAIAKYGAVQQIWPVDAARLPAWVRDRLARHGFKADPAVAALIADRVEGNLLAANQEIEKLTLLREPGQLDMQEVLDAVADSARYDVLQLGEAAMRGQGARALKVLDGLRGEGVEAVLILWAVNKDLQWVVRAQFLMQSGQSADSAMNAIGVWRPRQAAMKMALGRLKSADLKGLIRDASRTDRAIKGALRLDPWMQMQALVARFAGVRLSRVSAA